MNAVPDVAVSADETAGASNPAGLRSNGSLPHVAGNRLLLAAFLVGLWAALAGSIILVSTRSYFPVPPVPAEIAALIQPFQPIPPEANDAVNALERNTAYRNTSLSFSVLALATLPLMGLAAGWATDVPSGLKRGLVTGLALAVPIGIVAGVGGVTVAGLIRGAVPDGDPTMLMSIVHAAMWVFFSIGIALTVIAANTRWKRLVPSLVAATLAALGASVLHQLAAMVLAPMSRSEVLIPDGMLLSGMFAGFGFLLTSLAICYTLTQPGSAFQSKSADPEWAHRDKS